MYINVCFFKTPNLCIKDSSRARRVIDPLQKCLTHAAVTKIIDAAHARSILQRIEGEDLIVLDILYYKTCYATFTSKELIQ